MKFVEEIIVAAGIEGGSDAATAPVLNHPDANIPQYTMGVLDPTTRQLVTNRADFENAAGIEASPISFVSWIPYPVGFGQFNPQQNSWTTSNNIFVNRVQRLTAEPFTLALPQIWEFIPGVNWFTAVDPNTTYAIGIIDKYNWEIEQIVYSKRLYTYRPTSVNEVWGQVIQNLCTQINADKTYNVFAQPFQSELAGRFAFPLNSNFGNSIRFTAAEKLINPGGGVQNVWYDHQYRFEVTVEIPDPNIIHHPITSIYPVNVPDLNNANHIIDPFLIANAPEYYVPTVGNGYPYQVQKLERDNLALKGHIYPNWQYDPQAYSNVPVISEQLGLNVIYDRIVIDHFHRPLVESYSIREMPIRTIIFFARPIQDAFVAGVDINVEVVNAENACNPGVDDCGLPPIWPLADLNYTWNTRVSGAIATGSILNYFDRANNPAANQFNASISPGIPGYAANLPNGWILASPPRNGNFNVGANRGYALYDTTNAIAPFNYDTAVANEARTPLTFFEEFEDWVYGTNEFSPSGLGPNQ